MLPVVGELRPWADPEVVSIGRLPMRPPTTAQPDLAGARAADREASPWWRSLDGRWRFRLYDHPDRVPPSAVRAEPTGGGWTTVEVPGNWTLQGVGDHPHYTNVQMPFPGPPPALPDHNPTGVYRRAFTVPARWRGRRIVVHVGGAESVHAVFVNGRFAGYGTDSRLASEYDVTDHVETGRNELAIVVVRYSAQSYVEDQDQWWMAGLHREVFVEARGATHVHALACRTDLRPDGVGVADVRVVLGGVPPEPGWQVHAWVESLGGARLARAVRRVVPHRFEQPYLFGGHQVSMDFEVADARAWTPETPERVRVVAELVDPHGHTAEVHAQLVGFRRVEVADGELRVNGRRITVHGVNRHDHHPDRGKAVTVDDMRADLLEMRRHNITAVRCSHYPNDPRLLDLCDELGFYVVDEANIESHAYNTSLCHDARYRATWLARGTRMVERDANHPSVIMWSLGNESGYGAHHDALAGWIRRADPSRPLHYEGAVFHHGWDDGGRAATDVVCPMYPTIEAIAAYRGDRPLVMCEYSHAMGNSNGNLADYWDAIAANPRLQGGFVWEWKDHGIRTVLPNGKRGFAHGGHFGDEPNDGNFVADGIVSADLRPHPAVQELAWVYRPVAVSAAGRTRLRIENRRAFTGLDDLAAEWELLVAGEVWATGGLDVPEVGPGRSATVPLPVEVPTVPDSHLTVRWRTRRRTAWEPSGHLVAWDQVELHKPPARRRPSPRPSTVRPVGELLTAPVELALFRAPVDNDGFKLMSERDFGVGGHRLAAWQAAGLDRRPATEVLAELGGRHDHEVLIDVDGSQLHTHRVVLPEALDDVARVGITFGLPGRLDRLRWFGRGPLECYPDRDRGALLGVWEAEVDDMPYLVPQEHGMRTDCRWFACTDPRTGAGVRIRPLQPSALHVTVSRHTTADLYQAAHETDLVPRRHLTVHLDVAHRGLGTASCGPDTLPEYRVGAGEYRFAYRLSALS